MGDPEKRFPGLVDLVKSWIPWKSESHNDSRAFWMPDDSCIVCYDCDSQFTIFNRRHHCRKCGRVFCARCTSNFIPARSSYLKTNLEEGEWVRVCNYCFKLKGENTAVDTDEVQSSRLVLNRQSTSSLASISSNATENGNITTDTSLSYGNGAYQCLPYGFGSPTSQHVEFESFVDGQENIKAVTSMSPTKNNGECYPDHFGFSLNRSDDEDDDYGPCNPDSERKGLLKCSEPFGKINFPEVNKPNGLDDMHTPEGISDAKATGCKEHAEHAGMQCHASLSVDKMEEHCLGDNDRYRDSSFIYARGGADSKNVDLENSTQFWLPPEPENEDDDKESLILEYDEEDATGEWHDLHLSSSFDSCEVKSKDRLTEEHKKAMRSIVDGHFRALVAQLLQAENVEIDENDKGNWLDIVTSLSWEVASLLKPDTSNGGGMDPGLYVKVKCLACGHPSDSMLVKGVVCKKNVAHRRMTTKIEKPRLLLLGGALEYQRVSNSLSSFDTLLQQEMDHLKMAVAKIAVHNPNVLLVEKSVSRYAQDYLLAKNITLVLNIKRPLLERIARCTGAQIVPSIDHLSSPKLGQCDLFHVEKFLEEHGSAGQGGKFLKTLMFFEGCPKPLGYTILLKGGSGDELKKIKHVVQYGVFAAYHLALETSFLADEGASLPELPLKSPVTIALPDKPSSINRSITTIRGLGPYSAGKPQMANSSEKSFGSDLKLGPGDSHMTQDIELPCPSTRCEHSTSVSVSTLHDPSPDRKIFPAENDHLLSHIEAPEWKAASISFLESVDSVSNPLHHTSKEKHKIGIAAEAWSTTQRTEDQTEQHESVTSRSHINNSENGGLITNNAQTGDHKIIEEQHHSSELDISHQDCSFGHALLREEFPPSPSDHQSILVSLSSRCVAKGTVCERSHLFRIKYYGSFDKPLGRYLRDHLFDQSYRCHSCEMPSAAHIYCYTHRQGSLTISVKNLDGYSLPGERDGKIWMWHRCLRCPTEKGLPPATRRVVMSDAAWGLSFGKFLELSFSNHAAASRVASCGHSLHRDCLRFYGCGNMVACFRYAPINVNSVFLPPSKLDFSCQHQEWVQEEANKVAETADNLFMEVCNLLHQIAEGKAKSSSLDSDEKILESRIDILQLEGMLHEEKADFQESLQKVMRKDEKKGKPHIDILEINKLRRQLLFYSYIWDKRLSFAKKSYCGTGELRSYVATQKKENIASNLQRSITNFDSPSARGNESSLFSELSAETPERLDHDKHSEVSQQREDLKHDETNVMQNKDQLHTCTNTKQIESTELSVSFPRAFSDGGLANMLDLSDTLDAKWRGELGSALADKSSSLDGSLEHVGVGLIRSFASASNAKPGERAEDWIKKSASDIYHSYDQIPGGLPRFDISSEDSLDHVLFMKLQKQCQGRLLLPLGMNGIVIPVYDDEPTSIISYALVCPNYYSQLSDEAEGPGDEHLISLPSKELQKSGWAQHASDSIPLESSKSLESLDGSISSISSSKMSLALDQQAFTKRMHARVSFADNGKVKYNVTCYYANNFDALRRTCCPSETDFIRSLSRCKKWGAQGGKSNVFFAKSLDDRFIIKQVTRTELESFMKFAPEYFKYLSESINTGSPTCLAKILGIYQVAVKNLISGKESKMDLLIMENLLFGRQVTRLYDLKGSCRSRYNADSSGNNKVLLDQNLIEAMPTSPIFVGNKAKRLLERAVWNDTSFLASIDVMDYSLLVGIDEEKHELVLGIIDFMRQYTWDKHLETWVKAAGILGGAKNESPTVISPVQYKKRFRKAMSAYFLVVPDQWSPPSVDSGKSEAQEKPLDASDDA